MEGGHGMAEENVNQDGGRVEGRGARFPERGRPIERLKNSLACSILESILPPPPPWILLFPPPPPLSLSRRALASVQVRPVSGTILYVTAVWEET